MTQIRKNYEIDAIKKLGEEVGYGHLMYVASALWRRSLGKLKDGAFVPTLKSLIKKNFQSDDDLDNYDNIINEHLK